MELFILGIPQKSDYSLGRDGKGGEKFTSNIMNIEKNTKQPNHQDKSLNKIYTQAYRSLGYLGG